MKFNTLVFDANLPTTQQVNVPTNTDYKIGMKVKRNGEVKSIKPSEFTITAQDGTTLSADSEKTNGYVTITRASGDNASFKQYGVHIEHGYDFNDYVKQTGLMTDTGKYDFPDTLTVESLGIAGQVLTMDNISWGQKKQAGTPVDVNDITQWNVPATWGSVNYAFRWPNGNAAVNITRDGIGLFDEDGHPIEETDKVVLNPVWHLSYLNGGLRGTAGNYYVIAFQFQFGTPFSADFKLNINTFKSQQGDIAETVGKMPAVNVDGTYADGTEFSYSFVTK